MRIQDHIVKRILDNATIEYRGCHSSDINNPLYGRRAYYMIDHCKITFPVKSISPQKSTLEKGLFQELKARLESINCSIVLSWSNCASLEISDPYSVKRLLDTYIDNQYLDLPFKRSK